MGRQDIPADEIDADQAARVCGILKNEDCSLLYSSPLQRALETAQAIATQEFQILTDDRLVERGLGKWEGIPKTDVQIQYADAFQSGKMDFYYTPPEGESYQSMIQRVSSFLIDVYHPNQNIAVVTHNGVFRVMKSLLTGDGMSNVFSTFEPYLTPEIFPFDHVIWETLKRDPFFTIDKPASV